MTLTLPGGRRLVLAGLDVLPWWVAAGAVAVVLLLVLYRYERRLVGRRTGMVLLGLRLAAALSLVGSLLEPVLERVTRETVRGRVILGVDRSESMATIDPGPPARPRIDTAGQLLAQPWLRSLAAAHAVEAFAFARDAVPLPLDQLTDSRRTTPDPTADGTNWEPVLEAALAGQDDSPTLGVILLTDGRENARTSAQPAVERLRERGVPVYPVLIGSVSPPRDAAVAAVRVPETVDRGHSARIDVTVKADGLEPGTPLPVVLTRPGGPPLQEVVRAQAEGGRPVASFRVPFDAVGVQDVTVSVGPVPEDARPDNDRKALKVVVVDDKARVLLVDGEARWEFQYLRNALMRDPRVTLETVVLRQPMLPGDANPFYPAALPDRDGTASQDGTTTAPDPLNAFDAIIVGDVGPNALDREAWGRLEGYVAERGGTLVLSAGPRSYPSLADDETVGKLLPVRAPRPIAVDRGSIDPAHPTLPAGLALLPTLTAASGPWPMLQLAEDPEASRSIWESLPRLPWILAGEPKPTATPLAAVGTSASEADAALVAMPYGLGKVLWVGTDATWRWRFRVGDAYHHRFWGQVVQWAARGKLSSGNRLVQFGAMPPRVTEGEQAMVRARFTEPLPPGSGSLLVAAKVYAADDAATGDPPAGDPLAVISLPPRADQPHVFDGSIPRLPPGRYDVRLEVPQMAEAMRAAGGVPTAQLEITPQDSGERIELAASPDALEALARTTGGRLLSPAEVGEIPSLIQRRTTTRVRVEPTRLGERPEALLLFFGLLTIEWVMRKRAGLP